MKNRIKYLLFLFAVVWLSGCASISRQYYYEPSVAHQKIKAHLQHADYKMLYSKLLINGKAGDTIGYIVTGNGTGQPLLMGPFLPVIPVGGFFQKSRGNFQMDMSVHYNKGKLMPLNPAACYMIVNDTAKVPLKVNEYVTNDHAVQTYAFYCDARFSKINTVRLVTGNEKLDSILETITFNRRSRLKFDLVGPAY